MFRKLVIVWLLGCAFLGRISAQEVMIVREAKPQVPKAEVVAPKQPSAEFHIEKAIAVQAVKPPTPKPAANSTLSATAQVQKKQAMAAQPAKADVRTEKAVAVQPVKVPAPKPKADSATVQIGKQQSVVAQPVKTDVGTEKAIAVQAVKPATPQPKTGSVTVQVGEHPSIATQPAKTDVETKKAVAAQAVKPPAPQPKASSVTVQVGEHPPVATQPAKTDVETKKAIAAQTVKPSTPQPPANSTLSVATQVQKPKPIAAPPVKADVRSKQVAAAPPAKPQPQPRKPEAVTAASSTSGSGQVREHQGPVQSVALQGATAFTKLANGFDFPVGKPEAKGYYKARGFRSHGHLGEDWDGVGGGNTDLNDPIYCIGDGVVVFARDCHMGWGNVIIVRHAYREGGTVRNIDSMYGHLQKIMAHRGDVVTRGQQIGTMGTAHGLYDAHLHLEIRKNIEIGMSRAAFARDFNNYYDPTQFILAHRRLETGGKTYRIAMNTFTHDSRIQWDKLRNYSGYRGGGSSESAVALKKALASQTASQ